MCGEDAEDEEEEPQFQDGMAANNPTRSQAKDLQQERGKQKVFN
jgi:hypothetical protein